MWRTGQGGPPGDRARCDVDPIQGPGRPGSRNVYLAARVDTETASCPRRSDGTPRRCDSCSEINGSQLLSLTQPHEERSRCIEPYVGARCPKVSDRDGFPGGGIDRDQGAWVIWRHQRRDAVKNAGARMNRETRHANRHRARDPNRRDQLVRGGRRVDEVKIASDVR